MQFSDLLLTSDTRARDYYRRSYRRMQGYHYPTHFMEIPYWIPLTAGALPDERFEKRVLVVDDLDVGICDARANRDALYFFSLMDASFDQTTAMLRENAPSIIGGYVDPRQLDRFGNVTFLDSIDDLPNVVEGAREVASVDYRLFEGLRCIPRLSFSTGCSYRCKFCTVPFGVTSAPPERIREDVAALEPLDFELIFLDDKSFGQSANWTEAGSVGRQVSAYNRDFGGFIVQTTPAIAARRGFLETCAQLGVRFVEFGVEVADDRLLRWMNKPFRMQHLAASVARARELGLYVIPNLIIGLPNDDYRATLAWLAANVDVIPVVNVNWLAAHYGGERGTLGLPVTTREDRDQNASHKSWFADDDEERGWSAIEAMYEITDRFWEGRTADFKPFNWDAVG